MIFWQCPSIKWSLYHENKEFQLQLIKIFQNLKHLKVNGSGISGNDRLDTSLSIFARLPAFPKVESLDLVCVSMEFVELIKSTFSNVKTLKMHLITPPVSFRLLRNFGVEKLAFLLKSQNRPSI